jgi:hypothetical protein
MLIQWFFMIIEFIDKKTVAKHFLPIRGPEQ